MPALTVVMSTHNAMPYLPAAIRSICAQTFRDFTFLIIDDGSTDGTNDLLAQLSDPRIRVIRTPHRGVGVALNQGLALCETEFLACMDADDLALPERFERQLSFLRQNPEVGMVGCQFSYFSAPGTRVFSPFLPCDHDGIMRETLGRRLAIAHATLMFRTLVLRAVGGYRVRGHGSRLGCVPPDG